MTRAATNPLLGEYNSQECNTKISANNMIAYPPKFREKIMLKE